MMSRTDCAWKRGLLLLAGAVWLPTALSAGPGAPSCTQLGQVRIDGVLASPGGVWVGVDSTVACCALCNAFPSCAAWTVKQATCTLFNSSAFQVRSGAGTAGRIRCGACRCPVPRAHSSPSPPPPAGAGPVGGERRGARLTNPLRQPL